MVELCRFNVEEERRWRQKVDPLSLTNLLQEGSVLILVSLIIIPHMRAIEAMWAS